MERDLQNVRQVHPHKKGEGKGGGEHNVLGSLNTEPLFLDPDPVVAIC